MINRDIDVHLQNAQATFLNLYSWISKKTRSEATANYSYNHESGAQP